MAGAVPAPQVISDILDAPVETRSVEFKASFAWPHPSREAKRHPKAQEILKSVLGMSNLRDGGRIVVGVTDGGTATGIPPDELGTFRSDDIAPMLRTIGDPAPRARLELFNHRGMTFAVFSVEPFEFSPVICCTQEHSELKNGAIYTRSDKPESKRVTDPMELREILEIAVDKEVQIFQKRVLSLPTTTPDKDSLASLEEASRAKYELEISDIRKIT